MEHIISATERCIDRLGCGPVDMLLLHRPDAFMNPEEVVCAFRKLSERGLVKRFVVSNMTPAQMSYLRSAGDFSVTANQIEINLIQSQILDGGFSGNVPALDPPGVEGTLEYCGERGIKVQAYSPLGKGYTVDS